MHQAGFVHCDIKRPSNLSGLAFDNILLTTQGLWLIDEGIFAIKSKVGDEFFIKYLEVEVSELKEFSLYFLNR